MSYKRLTDKKIDMDNLSDKAKSRISDTYLVYAKINNALWELENKIENGTLVELPCKVGTTVYYIGSLEVRAFFKIKTIHDIVEMPFSLDMLDSYKIVWFTTKAEAEKKLEELSKNP